jgi:hypothetical protein
LMVAHRQSSLGKRQRAIQYTKEQRRFLKRRHSGFLRYSKRDHVAIHEAGHLIAILECGWPLDYATIIANGDMAGYCAYDISGYRRMTHWYAQHPERAIADAALVSIAGALATHVLLHDRAIDRFERLPGPFDYRILLDWIAAYAPDLDEAGRRKRAAVAIDQACAYFNDARRRQAVVLLASALIRHRTLTRAAVVHCARQFITIAPLKAAGDFRAESSGAWIRQTSLAGAPSKQCIVERDETQCTGTAGRGR